MRAIALMVLALLAAPFLLLGETINVPDDFETIQAAINAAENGDLVLVQPGRYNESISFEGKAITVASLYIETPDPQFITSTIIDPGGEGRGVRFSNEETDEARLIGFSITNGVANYGGGIYCSNSEPRLERLLIYNNHAVRFGGGVYATSNARPTLNWVTIANNTAEGGRGALHILNEAQPRVINSISWGNDPAPIIEGVIISYSDIQDGYDGQNIISEDPRFVAPGQADFTLRLDSPCIDTGDPNSGLDPDGSRSDLGALYFAQLPRINIAPPALHFGDVNVGRIGQINLTIRNVGNGRMEIENISIIPNESPFEIIEGGEAGGINAGQSRIVTVQFQPNDISEFQAVLRIISDDPDDPQYDVMVTGQGLPPIPEIMIEPNAFNFGNTPLYTTRNVNIVISNLGEAPLIIGNLEIIDDETDFFDVDFQDPIEVGVENVFETNVSYTPKDLGVHTSALIIECNDPDQPEINLNLVGNGIFPESRYAFTDNTGENHSILVLNAIIDNEPLAVGSEIAVLSPEGLCCGATFWPGDRIGFPAWGDNIVTEEIDGLRAEERMNIVIFDIISQQEYNTETELIQGDLIYSENGMTVLELNAVEGALPSYELALTSGWNLISAPINPEQRDVKVLWQPIVHNNNLDLLKDHFGRFYRPDWDFSNMLPWDFRFGYQARLGENDTLIFVGQEVPEDTPIPLRQGWSIAAYLPETRVDAPTALSPIVEVLRIAKDGVGRFYNPEFGFNNIPPLHQGQGYQIQVTQAVDLVWHVPNQAASVSNVIGNDRIPQKYLAPNNTGRNMSLLVLSAQGIDDGSELGIFTESISGEYNCIASTIISGQGPWGLALWGREEGNSPQGALEGERLSLRLWNGVTETVPEIELISGELSYQTDGFTALNISSAIPRDFTLDQPYPNPFNATAVIRFSLPDNNFTSLSVYDVNGRLINALAAGNLPRGIHQVHWDASHYSAGVYLFQLTASSAEHTVTLQQKAILIK